MVEFGTVQVYEAMADLLNADPEWADKGKNITYTMVYEYREPVGKAFLVRFDAGKIVDVRELPSADAEPADFVISGDPETWRAVLEKRTSPTAAMTRGQLKVQGKMSVLLKNMSAFSHILDSMTKIEFS